MTRKSLHVRLYVDQPPGDQPPRRGDFLVTQGKRGLGSAYLILTARRVVRPTCERFYLQCHRAELSDVAGRVVFMRWYSRNRVVR